MGTARKLKQVKSKSIDELPTEYLKCRAFAHAWDEFIPTNMKRPSFGFRFSLLCVNCGTERHDLLDTLGYLQDRGYKYPIGYQLEFKATKPECREEYSKRTRKRGRRGALLKEFGE